MGLGVGLFEAEDVDAERLGVGGFTVMLDIPLLELTAELARPSFLVIVTRTPVLAARSMI
ncbi:hypothetical protein RRF57_005732 [Xylaria bambusicola]|uniref:Uncharacterized protein n=1 Tax=Xylaria bambusicola TaxID=326684 RepID=A0AAN7UP24_9PEZI